MAYVGIAAASPPIFDDLGFGTVEYWTERRCTGCSFADVAANLCLVDGPTVTEATDCDALGGLYGQTMIYQLQLTSPSPPPMVVAPPAPFPPLPAPYYPAAIAGTNANWYAAGAFFVDPSKSVVAADAMWTNLNCAFVWYSEVTYTGQCVGPYEVGATATATTRASIIKSCQDLAASYGYDTVSLRDLTRTSTPFSTLLSSSCYACKGCAYYVGGSVPASGITCSPKVTNCDPAYDGLSCNTAATSCDTAGCRNCTLSTGRRARVNQVYRVRPAGAVLAPKPPSPPTRPPPPSPPPAMKCPAYTAANGGRKTCVLYNVRAGASLALGTSRIPGSLCTGDTYLRLLNSANQKVAENDDSDGTCSWLQYTVPTAGTYTISQECYGTTSCGGTVAYIII